jgi:hypothetical protein
MTAHAAPLIQGESSSILDETLAAIGAILGPELDEITVERVVVGLFFTGGQAYQWQRRQLRHRSCPKRTSC